MAKISIFMGFADFFADTSLKAFTLGAKIRKNIALAEAQSMGQNIFSYSPKSNGAKDYLALAKEIFQLETKEAVA